MTGRQDIDGGLVEIDPATPSGPPRLGELTAEIVSDVRFRHQVEHVCRHPRLVVEMLAELAAERSIRVLIEEKLARYASLSDEQLVAAHGNQMPPVPVHEVQR